MPVGHAVMVPCSLNSLGVENPAPFRTNIPVDKMVVIGDLAGDRPFDRISVLYLHVVNVAVERVALLVSSRQ